MRTSTPTLGRQLDFAQTLHASTKRDYIARVVEHDKADSAAIAGRFDAEYWDGDRRFGYGGYRYDGRWRGLAQRLADEYALAPGHNVLDIGCGKGFLLYELGQVVPGLRVNGLDISRYAIENAKPEIRSAITLGTAAHLPYPDASFDFVLSLGTLHNLAVEQLWSALEEIERVSRGSRKYVMVESYRNEREKANLLFWQLTCKSFYSVADWQWLYKKAGYRGDYDFIFFT
jgi:SAM-dependent methyltransferase